MRTIHRRTVSCISCSLSEEGRPLRARFQAWAPPATWKRIRKGRAYSTHSSTCQELPTSPPGFGVRDGGGEQPLDLRGQRADRGVERADLPAGRLARPGETDRDLITEQVREDEREQANVLQAAVDAAPRAGYRPGRALRRAALLKQQSRIRRHTLACAPLTVAEPRIRILSETGRPNGDLQVLARSLQFPSFRRRSRCFLP